MTLPREKQNDYQESFEWDFTHAAITATTTFKVRAPKRPFVVDSATYHNVTGLATHADNHYHGSVEIGGEEAVAMFNTDADDGAAIPADEFTDGVPVDGAVNGAADAEVTFVCTKGGTQTLPAGNLTIRGRYIG